MKIWYDACTGKQVRYGVAIARRLRKFGHKTILTTRSHPDTLALANLLKEKFINVGRYDPSSLLSRLKESLKRQLLLCEMFEEKPPKVAISHRSVDLCRVAFGLGVPNISTHDTPHAEAVNRLTMPLIDLLVVSKAIPRRYIERFGIKKILRFDGVDEVAWMKNFRPKIMYDYKRPLIVVRQFETRAVYAEGKEDVTETIAKKLTSLGNVLFLSRYKKQSEKKLVVRKKFVDSASLVAQADLVVSAGGTIAREAALQGTPAIVMPVIERLYVNDYLSTKGFPIFTVKPKRVLESSKKILGKKWKVKNLFENLEDPVDVIERVIKEEIEQ